MPRERKILLVIEGEKAEKRLLEAALSRYGINGGFKLYPYQANINMLYHDICDEDGSIPDDLDTMQVLKERERKLNPGFESDSRHVLLQRYTDILFVLDFDPHHAQAATDHALIMTEHFTDSTDEGKLLVNYPMVESYRHLRALPDTDYLSRVVSRKDCSRYKEIVGEDALPKLKQLSRYERATFDQIISHNYFKATRMIGVDALDLATCEKAIMKAQARMLAETNTLCVLNTCLFFMLDYWPSRIELEDPYSVIRPTIPEEQRGNG